MEHQDSGEVLTRERSRVTAFQENSKESECRWAYDGCSPVQTGYPGNKGKFINTCFNGGRSTHSAGGSLYQMRKVC